MRIYKEIYGQTQEGNLVEEYTMINTSGMEVSVLNLGCIITKILVPDKNGVFKNVVLTLNDLRGYEENPAYIGGVVGRYAGRIKEGTIAIDGKEHRLDKNDGENSLHGGFQGFNKMIWDVNEKIEGDICELRLTYLSKDGEGGFPGNLRVTVFYRVHEDNRLEITYEAISDIKTSISLTNHSYFNLSGEIQSVKEHNLSINTPYLLEVGEDFIPTGKIIYLNEYDLEASEYRKVKDYILALEKVSSFKGIDHPFLVNKSNSDDLALVVEYQHSSSGRKLLVYTDLPYVNIYSGNFLDKTILLERGKGAIKYGGICFEAQEQPNGPNGLDLGYKFLEPDQIYKRSTVLKFVVK